MHVRVDPHSLVPPSQQLVAAVLDAIGSGELKPGDKLPSVRGLAGEALVNPNTVAKAFRDLEHLGVTEGRNGSGVFVTAAGPDVSRALRLAETLASLRAAVQHALRAGHDGTVLHDVVAAAVRGVAADVALPVGNSEGEREGSRR